MIYLQCIGMCGMHELIDFRMSQRKGNHHQHPVHQKPSDVMVFLKYDHDV